MRKTTSHIAFATILTVGLTACGAGFDREVGAGLDEGSFGNPTMTNTLIANGELSAVESLTRKFAAEVPSMVNFDFNSSVLDETAKAALRQQANFIRNYPGVKWRVYGHTDKVGSNSYNKRLGLRRARAAVAYLSSQGISKARLEAVASFGETRPIVATPNAERRNRRTVTEVSGFNKGRPHNLDGKYGHEVYKEYVNTAKTPRTLSIEDAQ